MPRRRFRIKKRRGFKKRGRRSFSKKRRFRNKLVTRGSLSKILAKRSELKDIILSYEPNLVCPDVTQNLKDFMETATNSGENLITNTFNAIVKGTNAHQRIGNQIFVKYIEIRGQISPYY